MNGYKDKWEVRTHAGRWMDETNDKLQAETLAKAYEITHPQNAPYVVSLVTAEQQEQADKEKELSAEEARDRADSLSSRTLTVDRLGFVTITGVTDSHGDDLEFDIDSVDTVKWYKILAYAKTLDVEGES